MNKYKIIVWLKITCEFMEMIEEKTYIIEASNNQQVMAEIEHFMRITGKSNYQIKKVEKIND